jgi:hypothetical protein
MTPPFEASVLARLTKARPYLRPVQVRQLLQGDVTHRLAGSLQDSGGIIQVGAARESEAHVSGEHVNAQMPSAMTRSVALYSRTTFERISKMYS